MELWIYDSDGDIYVFKTKEAAMEAFKNWYVNRVLKWEAEKAHAISQMEKLGYFDDERIYPTELIE